MAQQRLDFGGGVPIGGIGSVESLNAALQKIEDNFGKLYAAPQSGPVGAVSVAGQTEDLVLNDSSNSAREANATRIQSAIDYAYNNGRQVIDLGAGVISTNQLYLDPPGNLRDDLSNPSMASFSLHLKGAGGLGNSENHGTQLLFADRTVPALIVGTGQGMRVSELSLRCSLNEASSRAALPEGGIGIALAGGGGGLSRGLIDNVTVSHFRDGIKTGFNSDALCDSVTLFKVSVNGCYRGIDFSNTQNYINSLYDCTFSQNTYHVYSTVRKPINIYGGNYSTFEALRKRFALSSVSALTAFTDNEGPLGDFTNWSFQATLTSPDQPMADGAYDAFVIKTAKFGAVPLKLVAYNSGTGVATLAFYSGWLFSQYVVGLVNLKSDTAIEADLQAATHLYACETTNMFFGSVNVNGVHIENTSAFTRLLDQNGGNDPISSITKTHLQYEFTFQVLANAGNDQEALFLCQQVFPFIRQTNAAEYRIALNDTTFGGGPNLSYGKDSFLIECRDTARERLISRNCNIYSPNLYVLGGNNIHTATDWTKSMAMGYGEWDDAPFMAEAETNQFYAQTKLNSVPYIGWSPSGVPKISSAQLTAIQSGPPELGSYPLLHGNTTYSVVDHPAGGGSVMFARSTHQFWSYGQDLTIDWTYKGRSHALYVDDTSRLFHGLKIILDNGSGDQHYVITGVYKALGYVTLLNVSNGGASNTTGLAGDKDTTYTGSTIKQEPYSITTLSGT